MGRRALSAERRTLEKEKRDMKIYVILESDVSPNALRSSYNPDSLYLSRTPGQTNMSHEDREKGWLGTTGANDAYALGVVDTDEEGWLDALREMVGNDFRWDARAVQEWAATDPAGYDEYDDQDLALDPISAVRSEGAHWDEESEDGGYWPEPNETWTFIAVLETDGEEVEGVDGQTCKWADEVLTAAGIEHDYQRHETYNSGTSGVDWEIVAVREADWDRAVDALTAAGIVDTANRSA